jgi:hypothetical protein
VRCVPVVAAALAAQFLVATPARCADEPGDLGDRIVAFCKEHRGKRVGNGECTSLVTAALLSAGAKPHGWGDHRRQPPKRGEINWGELVYTLERNGEDLKWTGKFDDIRRGDILQFRNVQLAGSTNIGTYSAQAQHHSAIIYGMDKEEGILKIYHQNFNGHKAVMTDRVRLADLQDGRFSVYHPLPAARRPSDD